MTPKMTPEEIKEKVLSFSWEHWFDRPLGPFMLSCFKGGVARPYMKKAGVDAQMSGRFNLPLEG